MAIPDNKYCPECIYFGGRDWDEIQEYYQKHGNRGCSGIPSATGEFPFNYHPHCFSDQLPPEPDYEI